MAKKKTVTTKTATKKTVPKKSARNKSAKGSKRELINTGSDKRFVRRDRAGKFDESDDVGKSLSQDRRRKAKRPAKSGQGDKGDRKRK